MTGSELQRFVRSLLANHDECEWLEFKSSQQDPEEIGEYISAIANSAALVGRETGYVIWGIEDGTREIVGTTFRPDKKKVNGQELESWLLHHLHPRLDFKWREVSFESRAVVLLEIPGAVHTPIRFRDHEFVRVGSYKKRLKEYPEKERTLWMRCSPQPFEVQPAMSGATASLVLELLDHEKFIVMSGSPEPSSACAAVSQFESEGLVRRESTDTYSITNLGALLFARSLARFSGLGRKILRVVEYQGGNRVKRLREKAFESGYAVAFEEAIRHLNSRIPKNEVLGEAIRREVPMYPALAIRELVANAVIHQDLLVSGVSPLVEIFSDRIEITNPGEPLIHPLRFLDAPPRSRNERIASLMRRLGICEEVGSGIDKVAFELELYQLPAPDFQTLPSHTRATLFAHKELSEMDRDDKVRACYLHAALECVSHRQMTNASLRKRLGIPDDRYPMASKIISETVEAGLIRPHDPGNRSRKHAKYLPFWA